MTPEQEQKFNDMIRKTDEVYEFMLSQKNGFEADSEAKRVSNGLGFIGRDVTTTPTGSVIVNTPEGPIKVLVA